MTTAEMPSGLGGAAPGVASHLPRSVFVSHGAPTMAVRPGAAGNALGVFAAGLQRPRAVLVVSAHWQTPEVRLASRERQAAWHDFRGFPAPLYALRYDAPGAPALAERVRNLLVAAGIPATLDPERPLDHGAWVPLRLMWPAADVPVLQMSMPMRATPAQLVGIGAALAALARDDILVLASGSFTHNLREVDFAHEDAPASDYVQAFRTWMIDRLEAGDRQALLAWRGEAPHAARAHPTDEHLLPLFVALGAAGDDVARVERLTDEVTYGVLAMDAFAFGHPGPNGPIMQPASGEPR